MLEKTENIRKIHDLVALGKDAGIPENLIDDLKELTLAYIYSRYPDTSPVSDMESKIPRFINAAQEVLEWVKKQLS